jgi:hypothetical protein
LLYKYVVKTSTDTTIRSWDNIGGSVVASDLAASLAAPTGSALVGYLPSGTGAVATTVQSKLRESVSVLDFLPAGYVTDGSVDYTTQIQAALTAANRVYFPSGSYLITTVNLKANQTVYGDGASSIIIQSVDAVATGTSNGVFYADSGSTSAFLDGITVRDLRFQGQVATLGFFEFLHLLSLNGVSNVNIERCHFYGWRGDGVYIGCSATGSTERHNKNIHISDCLFDGVNNDNRNGISVIDGEGIFITNNKFINCTRTNMPGAIDFEPNGSDAWHILRNCIVTGNHFEHCGGNVASVGFYLAGSAGWTLKPECFVVTNNTQITPIAGSASSAFAAVILGTDGADTVGHVSITGNTVHSFKPFDIRQVNGVAIANNVFNSDAGGFIGFNATDTQKNTSITGNVFVGGNVNYAIIVRGVVTDVVISSNTFTSHLNAAILVGGSGSTLKGVTVTNNTFRSISGTAQSVLNGGGTIDGATCVYMNNTWEGTHSFPAWRTDYTGSVVESFDSSTLPDTFPYGICVAAINGDTGVPATGSYQGILTNYAQTSLAAKYRYQTYDIANNGVAVGTTYIRRRNNAANTWTAWYTITGV